jgi:hypothetical protein
MRLNWFAPAAGPAARGAAAVLPALRRRAEVAVWTGRPGTGAWDAINRAAASIHHLDADRPGDPCLWELLRHHPGIAVLYDDGRAAPPPAPLARLAEEAASVLVHSWPSYGALKRCHGCPVIYRPLPRDEGGAEDWARDLLHLVALARRNGPAAAGLRLAARAGAEMAMWVSGLADEAAYRRVAEAIRDLVA